MLGFDLYPWFSLLASIALTIMLGVHLRRAIVTYRRHHDPRAAQDLLIGLVLVVAGVGLIVGALARFTPPDWVPVMEIRQAGLSLTRGALLVGSITLLFFRPRPET